VSLAGPRRSWEAGREQRTYRCRACRTSAVDYWPPFGWLQVRTRDPQAAPGDHTYTLIGFFCSAACLARAATGWAAATAEGDTG